jgi:hypothetical protein
MTEMLFLPLLPSCISHGFYWRWNNFGTGNIQESSVLSVSYCDLGAAAVAAMQALVSKLLIQPK